MNDGRLQRMRTALDARLGTVRCAIESVYHRHNVSAILRTCDSLGLHHVHLVEGHFSPAKGAARGAERWLQLHRERSAEEAIATLRRSGFRIWIADLAEDSVAPEEVPVDAPICLWFGAELVGVSEIARAAADGVVTVPMRGLAQSLNVSVAAALTLRPVAERARAQGTASRLPEAERNDIWKQWLAREETLRNGVRARVNQRLPPPEDVP
jgi:tRNA (guanosine-2'-O-)-methyltransferase